MAKWTEPATKDPHGRLSGAAYEEEWERVRALEAEKYQEALDKLRAKTAPKHIPPEFLITPYRINDGDERMKEIYERACAEVKNDPDADPETVLYCERQLAVYTEKVAELQKSMESIGCVMNDKVRDLEKRANEYYRKK